MKVLLDTHALLWWLADDGRLSEKARGIIANPTHQIFVSAASGWEMSIKQALGKLDVCLESVITEIEKNGFTMLDISFQHSAIAGALPQHHRDPFDRMLIAQTQCESLKLLSMDRQLAQYDIQIFW